MPKNTYFIKENYKKVEEVREIENQIPTVPTLNTSVLDKLQ